MRRRKIWVDYEEKLHADGVYEDEWDIFKVYKNKSALEADVKNPDLFNVWVEYPNPDAPEPLSKKMVANRQSQRKYETFCGGFLYYHDEEFKRYSDSEGKGYTSEKGYIEAKNYPSWRDYLNSKKAKNEEVYDTGTEYFEHHIYFEWNKKENTVRIYINKTPDEYNSDPPKPPAPPPPES